LARHDTTRGRARVGAVEAETDATTHPRNIRLGQVRARADRAGDGALSAGLDAARDRVEITAGPGMGCEQLLQVTYLS
jgi:hypothetical protein